METIEELLDLMPARGAADLIISEGAPAQLRINGYLQPVSPEALTADRTRHYVESLLNPKQLEQLEKNRSIDLSKAYKDSMRFRVNAFYQLGSLSLAIRLIPMRIPSFKELNLPDTIEFFANRPHGLFLVTGPAGNGKSTTLAAMIDYINQRKHVHVVCIEDPVEFVHRHTKAVIEQREVLQDAQSFQEALRSVFRQSPDIIMVGEMRDLETIRLALTLAETGHLILATLHTHDTTNALNRIVSVFPLSEQQQVYTQLSMVLAGVISQVLIPSVDESKLVLGYEVMRRNTAISNLIREQHTQQIYSAIQMGKGEGMITMNECLVDLVKQGLITRQRAIERSPRPKEILRMLEGIAGKEVAV